MIYNSHHLFLSALEACVQAPQDSFDCVLLFRHHAKDNKAQVNQSILNTDGDIARDGLGPAIFNQIMMILYDKSHAFSQSHYKLCEVFANLMIARGYRDEPDFETASRLAAVCAAGNYHQYASQGGFIQKYRESRERGLCKEDKYVIQLINNWGEGPSSDALIFSFIADRLHPGDLHQWAHQNGVLKKKEYLSRLHFQMKQICAQHACTSEIDFLSELYNVCYQLNHLTGQSRWCEIIDLIVEKVKESAATGRLYLNPETMLDSLKMAHNQSDDYMSFDQFMRCVDPALGCKISQLHYLYRLFYTIEEQILQDNNRVGMSAQTKLLDFLIHKVQLPPTPMFAYLWVKAHSKPQSTSLWQSSSPYLFHDHDALNKLLLMHDIDNLNMLYTRIAIFMTEHCHPDSFRDGYLNPEAFMDRLIIQLIDAVHTLQFDDDKIQSIETIIMLSHNQNDLWGKMKSVYPSISSLGSIMQRARASSLYHGLEVREDEGIIQVISNILFSPNCLWDENTWHIMDAWVNGYQKSHNAKQYNINSLYKWSAQTVSDTVEIYHDLHPDLVPKTNLSVIQTVPHYIQSAISIHWSQTKSDRVSPTIQNITNDGHKLAKLTDRLQDYTTALSSRIEAMIQGTSIKVYALYEGGYMLPGQSILNVMMYCLAPVFFKGLTGWFKGLIKSGDARGSGSNKMDKLLRSMMSEEVNELLLIIEDLQLCIGKIVADNGQGAFDMMLDDVGRIIEGMSSNDRMQYMMQRTLADDALKLHNDSKMLGNHVQVFSRLLLDLKQRLISVAKSEPFQSIMRDASTTNMLRGLDLQFDYQQVTPMGPAIAKAELPRQGVSTEVDYSVIADEVKGAIYHIADASYLMTRVIADLSSSILGDYGFVNSVGIRQAINNISWLGDSIQNRLNLMLQEKQFSTFSGFLGLLYLYYFPKTDNLSQQIFAVMTLLFKISNPIGWLFLARDIYVIRRAKTQVRALVKALGDVKNTLGQCFDNDNVISRFEVVLGHLSSLPQDIEGDDKSIVFSRIWAVVDQLSDGVDHLDECSRDGTLTALEHTMGDLFGAFKDAFNNPFLKRLAQHYIFSTRLFDHLTDAVVKDTITAEELAHPVAERINDREELAGDYQSSCAFTQHHERQVYC